MAFRFDQLTLKSQEAVQAAPGDRPERGHQRLEPMHLLAALLDPDQAVIRSLLGQLGVNPAQVLQGGRGGPERAAQGHGRRDDARPRPGRVLDAAQDEADRMKDQYVSVEHLLLALTKVKSRAQELLGGARGDREGRPPGLAEGPRGRSGSPTRTPTTSTRRSRSTAATSSSSPATARWTRSSAATRRSAASSRSSAGGPRTTRS